MRKLLALVATVFLLAVPTRAVADPPTTCFTQTINDNRATDGDDYLSGTADGDVIASDSGLLWTIVVIFIIVVLVLAISRRL
jgi:hypothetical protein